MPTTTRTRGPARTKAAVVPPPDDTPARLKAAALRCVSKWGLAKTGVGDIAKEAGCARQTLYNHFPDADAVISAALFDASAAFVERLRTEIALHRTAGERIVAAMRHCLDELPKEPLLELVVSPEAASFANASAFRLPHVWSLVRAIAADCLAPAPELAPRADELAEMMTRLLLSMLVIEPPSRRSAAERDALVGRWLLPPMGLYPKPPTRRGPAR